MTLSNNEKRELTNLIFWCMRPANVLAALSHFLFLLVQYVIRNYVPLKYVYPGKIRKLAGSIKFPNADTMMEQNQSSVSERRGPSYLKLATGSIPFSDAPDWDMQFMDGEQFVSLHRWGWLLRAVSTKSEKSTNLEWGLHLMRSWLASKTALPRGLASEPYTVSERIANAVLFCRLVGGQLAVHALRYRARFSWKGKVSGQQS